MNSSQPFFHWLRGLVTVGLIVCMGAGSPEIAHTPLLVVAPSIVNVTASVDLKTAQAAINSVMQAQAIKDQLHIDAYNLNVGGGADNCGKGVSVGYDVSPGNVTLSASGNTVTGSAPISYWLKARARFPCFGKNGPLVNGSCGVQPEPFRQMSLSLSATVSGVDPTWTPLIAANLASLAADNRCKVTIINYDVTDTLTSATRTAITSALPSLADKVIAALNLHSNAQAAWTQLLAPIQLSPNTWLSFNPQSAGLAPIQSNAGALSETLQIVAKPTIVYAASAPSVVTSALPAPTTVMASHTFSVLLPVTAAYSMVTEQMSELVPFRLPDSGDPYMDIKSLALTGHGTHITLEVHGRYSKASHTEITLYLTGTPKVDENLSVLSFPDLEFTETSNNKLVDLGVAIAHKSIRNDLRHRAVLTFGSKITTARQQLQHALNREIGVATLKGTVDHLSIVGVQTGVNQMTAFFKTDGTLDLSL